MTLFTTRFNVSLYVCIMHSVLNPFLFDIVPVPNYPFLFCLSAWCCIGRFPFCLLYRKYLSFFLSFSTLLVVSIIRVLRV